MSIFYNLDWTQNETLLKLDMIPQCIKNNSKVRVLRTLCMSSIEYHFEYLCKNTLIKIITTQSLDSYLAMHALT